ncbi:PKHD1 like 1, tandem duplicate 1 isoform X2 [Amia ocellicauda]|uniref:PKHD1 like 1, tandem duplicate 1 isoform X2 n=1 Tax=Amia ocellicauda TaxID=2972642 RepID=UPI0034643A23
MKLPLKLLLLFAVLSFSDAQTFIYKVTPKTGSLNGATRLTIEGSGFAQANQFNFGAGNDNLGNLVQLVSDTRSIPCDVEKDSSHAQMITCYTRAMPEDSYVVQVSVDGVQVPESNICNGYYKSYWCSFYPAHYRTPLISSLSPSTGLPGTLITMHGLIFTDVYGSNTDKSSNGLDVRVLRVYIGGMPCELLQPNSDIRYGLTLDSQYSTWGTMICKMTGTYVGHHNLSFILDSEFGRSLPDLTLYTTSSLNKLTMFQSYAEVIGVSPSAGSLQGGTTLTIYGQYFDETDQPAQVLVGGNNCLVLSLSNDKIICRSPAYMMPNTTLFPGGRGLKLEVWNNSIPNTLDMAMNYNATRPGYSVTWVDSLSYKWADAFDFFVAKLSGFIVPSETDNYWFAVKGDDRFALYFSKTGSPSDKVKIAWDYFVHSEVMHLQEGKAYYIEVWLQEYAGVAFVDVGMFKGKSSYTPQQTAEAVNEVQLIQTVCNNLQEKQFLRLENWSKGNPVNEVQKVTVTSNCTSSDTCWYSYRLIYNSEKTALLSADASAEQIQNVLNALWSIKPDTVQVTKVDLSQGSEYTVTFNSQRGDFESLQYETSDTDVNITVVEVTKGQPSLDTFTINWDGMLSRPVSATASATEVQWAIEDLVSAQCSSNLKYTESNAVKFFRDYEANERLGYPSGELVSDSEAFCGRYSLRNPWLIFRSTDIQESGSPYRDIPLQLYSMFCFAYKGILQNIVQVTFSYTNTENVMIYTSFVIPTTFAQGDEWQYTCIDLLSPLKTSNPGTAYMLQYLYLFKVPSNQDFYVDAVYIGRMAATSTFNDITTERRPPALAQRGIFLQDIMVNKIQEPAISNASFEITVTPYYCGYDLPLLAIAFAQVFSNGSTEEALYGGPSWNAGAAIHVIRTQRASPPVSGFFDVEIYGKQIIGVPVNVSDLDLQYILQGIPEMGRIQVSHWGDCKGYNWKVEWLSRPGDQPLIQINSSSVTGPACSIQVSVVQEGGLFKQNIMGDYLRVPETKPQVQVFINGIPSMCSGDCGFQWSAAKTPVVSDVSPTEGSNALGTILTITGSGFGSGNASVLVGDTECAIIQMNSTWITCTVGNASAGTYPVSLSFAELGLALNVNAFNFTYQMGVLNISPSSGSIAGGTVLTVSGYAFSQDIMIRIGLKMCAVVSASFNELKCRTPPGSAGTVTMALKMGETEVSVNDPFTYDESKTPLITEISSRTTNVMGNMSISIGGSNFQDQTSSSSVSIGSETCEILEWSSNIITCSLPKLPPGLYNIFVQVGNWGYAAVGAGVNASIEYILKVTDVSPLQGSLYGGTKVIVTGLGFSAQAEDNTVTFGNYPCSITSASETQLECVTHLNENLYIITNQGIHPAYGVGYAWSPSSMQVSVGDTVQWQWQAPYLVKGLGYRVFSVSNPSDTTYDGIGFTSGDIKTDLGVFRYRFTVPGVYYYSSGFLDNTNTRSMQGVVQVQPVQPNSGRFQLTVGNISAPTDVQPMMPTVTECISTPPNCSQFLEAEGDFSFYFSDCYSPTITVISPSSGTVYDVIQIKGMGFSNTSCANEVKIGEYPCIVINSTMTEINCNLSPDNGMGVGVAELVSVQVNNLGTAINSIVKEFSRRFVLLPVIDSISPDTGATTGQTRVTIHGSGFSGQADSIAVTVAKQPCSIVSITYTAITCDTSPSTVQTGDIQVSMLGISAICHSNCTFEYSDSFVPSISSVSPAIINSSSTILTISGSGFGSQPEDVAVFVDGLILEVSAVTNTNVICTVGPLFAGAHILTVVVMSKGLATGSATLQSVASATLTPNYGSVKGGTPLFIMGNGFSQGNTSVTVGGSPCQAVFVTPSEVQCITPAHSEGTAEVKIQVLSISYPTLNYIYAWSYTPNITAVSPGTGSSGTVITLTGSGFGSDPELVSVTIDDTPCNVSAVTDVQIQCSVGNHAGGTFPVMLHHVLKGFAASAVVFKYELILASVTPVEGSYGGGSILTLQGSGFDPQTSQVLVCSQECNVLSQISTSSSLYCEVPPSNGTGTQQDCTVKVMNGQESVNVSNGFSYKLSLTPVITEVSPRRGGTAGGTRLTITGSNFSLNSSDITVTIAGSECDVQSANSTQIICITNAQPKTQKTKVKVYTGNNGIAKLDNADFFYIDVWSSKYTWGGLSPPEMGTFAVITEGQTILLDTSTPVLKMLLIQGGTLLFDEADIELQAENIMITDGGVLQVGTEAEPFQHKAIITLHGHLRSLELPVYGAKTLAVREGILDLHGMPVPVTWTHLAETAASGSLTLTLKRAVTWKAGDEIVIASTGHRHSQIENEVKKIASVSADGRTLNLTEPLSYSHLGVSVTLPDGTVFEARAEVGLLTRNVVVRGSDNIEWSDKIEACPDGFDTGEFATQTCFQGRFGEEAGSDQFGGCIMFHTPRPSESLAIGRIEYVEVFHAGQAFRLGRYPIHWHLMGDVQFKSYVRGCGIHQTYNRAVTIHNTHNLLVEKNVIYDIMGGAFFIEDGIETGNILQYNLAVFVHQSTSLLNDDVTPAAYWVTNPNNTIRHNAAAGGTHFGFWYRMHDNPDGPSYDPNICQKRVPLGEFFNNTVHSQGWFGIWIFQEYFPMKTGACYSFEPEPAIFNSLTTWNCQKGAEWVNVGAVHFNNFLMVNNEIAGIETKRIISSAVRGWGQTSGAAITNATIVGHVDELGLGVNYCTTRGIILPFDDGLSIMSVKFLLFDRPTCAAIGVTSIDGTCTFKCGGWSARFSGIQYFNTTNKAGFRWEHEVVLIDSDGSLTGQADNKVVPQSGLLDPSHCAQRAEWSMGFPGFVCDSTVGFHRVAFNNPSPSSLQAKNVIMSNSYGNSVVPYLTKRLTHEPGWMALLPDSNSIHWHFENVDHITDISYSSMFYGFRQQDNIIISHNLTQRPDMFHIIDVRNESTHPLNFSNNQNGDWYFNDNTTTVYYMVSGKKNVRSRRSTSVDPSMSDIDVEFSVYRYYYKNCISPPPLPAFPPIPSTGNLGTVGEGRPENYVLWSNESFWKSSPENNYAVPKEGADVVIPAVIWMVLDIDVPSFNKITVYGVLELPDNITSPATLAVNSTFTYRKIILNVTYISIQGGKLFAGRQDDPFKGELEIILRGNHFTPDWPLSEVNQGAKVIGVFGVLELHGLPRSVYHTKLANTAPAGSSIITLKDAVDWKVGDEIVITTTSYDPWQTETRKIAMISEDGQSLTLNKSLSYSHAGENFNVTGGQQSYSLAGEVGLLSRNIKIIGEDYPNWYQESFGARVLVSSISYSGIQYKGYAKIRNVEFYHSGQEGYRDYIDPRYSVAFVNLGEVTINDSYVQGCAFHHGFSPAIGVFGTDGLTIDDNVIYFTVGEGIRVWGNKNIIRRNLVSMSVWPGTYQDREETTNTLWHAAIEVNNGRNNVLQDNIVAGFERVGYRINGEPCPGIFNPVESWYNNEVHGGLFGVYMNRDGLTNCSHIQGFTVWKCWDYGIYFQTEMSVQISNITLVDNGMGIMSIIFTPPSVLHLYSDKTVQIQDGLIVGSSPNFNCSDVLKVTDANVKLSSSHRAPRPPTGGRSGVCWPTFASDHNGAPDKPHDGLMNYNAISGLLTVTNTVFESFQSVCSREKNVIFMTSPNNEDLQHPVHVQNLTIVNSTEDAKIFIHRPDVTKANPSDCVDMDCDAKKKALLKDLDGSLFGNVGAVVPQSEYQWNGDKRHGLGDYRIPKVMLTYLNGSRIPVNQLAPYKGIIRDSSCTYMTEWQSYKCFGLNYEMLAIESLDVDTETRRLSPVAVLGDRYIDLINGPQDHGWCAGYTCQKRVSLFHSIVATNKSYDIFFTSTSPQKLRFMLLNADSTKVVRVAVFYSSPQRLDVYVQNKLVAPTNANWNDQKTDYTLDEPTYPGQYVPQMNSTVYGSNYLDNDYKMLNVLVRGSIPVEIHTSPLLFISFRLPAMTIEQFFGKDLLRNLAAFLKVPQGMIRISKVVRENSRRRRRAAGLSVQVQISQPPVQQISNSSSTDQQNYDLLKTIASNIGQAAVSGNLSQSIGFNVSSVGITPPVPPPTDAAWSQVSAQDVSRTTPAESYVSSVSALVVVVQPVAVEGEQLMRQQPCIMAVDSGGNCVSVGVTTLTLSAVLKDSNSSIIPGLTGNSTIPFSNCWANYTDLSLNTTGTNLTLTFTLNQVEAKSKSFSNRAAVVNPTTSTANPTAPSGNGITSQSTTLNANHTIRTGTVYILAILYALKLTLFSF